MPRLPPVTTARRPVSSKSTVDPFDVPCPTVNSPAPPPCSASSSGSSVRAGRFPLGPGSVPGRSPRSPAVPRRPAAAGALTRASGLGRFADERNSPCCPQFSGCSADPAAAVTVPENSTKASACGACFPSYPLSRSPGPRTPITGCCVPRERAAFFAAALPVRLGSAMQSLGLVLLVHGGTGSFGAAGLVSGAFSLSSAVASPRLARVMDRVGQPRGPAAVPGGLRTGHGPRPADGRRARARCP